MKKGYFIFSFILFSFLLLPISVDAAVQCDYKINSSSLSGIKEATVSCEFSYRTNAFSSFFLGDLDYSCKYNETGTTKKKKVTIMDANTDARSGFNLTEHIKNNNSCPKYLYINPKGLYAYAVNSNDNIKKMEDYALKNLSGKWTAAADINQLQDPQVQQRNCSGYQNHLDQILSQLKDQQDKYNALNCAAFKLTDAEKNSVAGAANVKLARECDDILSASITLSNNGNKELDSYASKSCLSKTSQEYLNYKNAFNNYNTTATQILNNINSQMKNNSSSNNTQHSNSVDISDFQNQQTCEGVFGAVDSDGNFEEESFGWLLQTILNYMKIAGPVLMILFSMFEFIKAIAVSDEETMKKAQSRLVTRIIAVVILFLLPYLVGEILKLINGISNPTCYLR